MSRTALVLGATGLIGGHLLKRLLSQDSGELAIRVLARKACPPALRELSGGTTGGRLDWRVVDFEKLHSRDFEGITEVYCCLGTTIKQAGSQGVFRRVDHDYVVSAARLSAAAGASRFLLVSSVGANSASPAFYLKTKGDTEAAVRGSGIAEIHVLRPSFLLGERAGSRPLEKLSLAMLGPLAPAMAGPLRRYRPIQADEVARILLALGDGPSRPGFHVHEGRDLR